MAGRFENKIAVVTGGSSGIGLATAKAFAAEGATVVIAGRGAAALADAAAAISQESGGEVASYQLDVSSLASIQEVFAAITARFGVIDALFVNAGASSMIPIERVTEADWDKIHSTNLKGVFFTIQAALTALKPGSAVVINASVAPHAPIPGCSIYAASKAGATTLGRTLAVELAPRGIRVNVVSPGPTDTPLAGRTIGVPAEAVPHVREMMAKTPLGRAGHPGEIAEAVLFLASSGYTTGTELIVDGGISAA